MAVRLPFDLGPEGRQALEDTFAEVAASHTVNLDKLDARLVFACELEGIASLGATLIAAGVYTNQIVAQEIAATLVDAITRRVQKAVIDSPPEGGRIALS